MFNANMLLVCEMFQEIFGKVLEVKNLPRPEDYTDLDLIKIIRRYGNVCHHVLFHRRKRVIASPVCKIKPMN